MKNQFKLTPEAYKSIKELSTSLPRIAKTDNSGKVLYRGLSRVILGKDLTPEQLKSLHLPTAPKDTDKFVQKYSEAILVNHEVALVDAYKKQGQVGIDNYMLHVKSIVDKAKLEKEKPNEMQNSEVQEEKI